MAKELQAIEFILGNEKYAANISAISSIEQNSEVVRIPNSPKYMLGVCTVQDKITPVIDLKGLLDIQDTGSTEESCLIVFSTEEIDIGFIVNATDNILTIEEASIDKTILAPYMLGIVKLADGKLIILLDLENLLTKEQVKNIQNVCGERSG